MLDKFNRQALFDIGFDIGYRKGQIETVRRLREEGMSDEFIRKIVDMSSEDWALL